jgi:3-isopropylmalate/(R)-2-methylmalate dehydratase small subunit
MTGWSALTSQLVPLPLDDIDTDQIIPARFLKTTTKTGLGAHLFGDWCQVPSFVLNRSDLQAAQILLAGANFGCGSSREHAPWALLDWGFRAVIAKSFGDIFKNNALKCGLLPVELPPQAWRWLHERTTHDPHLAVSVDLEHSLVDVACPRSVDSPFPAHFSIDKFARRCLLDGVDPLSYLLAAMPAIEAYENARA